MPLAEAVKCLKKFEANRFTTSWIGHIEVELNLAYGSVRRLLFCKSISCTVIYRAVSSSFQIGYLMDEVSDKIDKAQGTSACSESHMHTTFLDLQTMSHWAFDFEKLISSLGLLVDQCGKTSRVLIVFNAEGHPVLTFSVQSPHIKGPVLGVVVCPES